MEAQDTGSKAAATPVGGAGAGAVAAARPRGRVGRVARRFLVRGETAVASAGIGLAAVLLGSMAASGWWTLQGQRAAAEAVRAEQVGTIANLLSQTVEPLLAVNDLAAVRRIVAEAGITHSLTRCRVVLPDGQVVASSAPGESGIPSLPANWANLRRLPAAADPHAPAINLTIPLNVPGRGPAELQLAGDSLPPLTTYWETQTGLGGIGAVALGALLVIYRRLRARFRAIGAIRDVLLAAPVGQVPGGAALSPALGPEAEAWNALVAEAERARRQDAADRVREALGRRRQSKGDLDAACDAMSQGLLLVDDRGRVTYSNGAAAAFLRADRDKLVGTDLAAHLTVPHVLAAIREVTAGQRRRATVDVEGALDEAAAAAQGGGGPPHGGVLRFSIRPVRREDAAAAMIVIDDVTQQKAADEARHSFVAHATHELRTPLTNIRLYVETAIEDGEQDPATRARCLNVINAEARRLERIVGEMLSVAEIEAGSFKLKTDDVRLDALFEELRQDFGEQAKEKQIRLAFNLPPKLPVIQGDRDKVMMALHNVVGNALKYTPAGGTVTVAVEADAARVAVAVTDTGIGIAPADQERIFERFYRADDKRVAKITGTGLGLTLAREVARLHGGDVTVESVLNQGSTFTLVLPARTVSAAA